MLNPLLERSSPELAPWLSSLDSAVDLVGDPSRRRMDSRRHIPIRLFGFPEILEAQEGGAFPSKGFQLLALLLRSPSRRLTRREAASFLWDSESDAESLINLRQLIHRIRKALPGNQRPDHCRCPHNSSRRRGSRD